MASEEPKQPTKLVIVDSTGKKHDLVHDDGPPAHQSSKPAKKSRLEEPASDSDEETSAADHQADKTSCPLGCTEEQFTALGLVLHLKKKHPDHPDGKRDSKAIAAKYNIPRLTQGQIDGQRLRVANFQRKKAIKMGEAEVKAEQARAYRRASLEDKENVTPNGDEDKRKNGVYCPEFCSDTKYQAFGLLLHLQKSHKDHEDVKLTAKELAAKYGLPEKSEAQMVGDLKRRATVAKKMAARAGKLRKGRDYDEEDDDTAEEDWSQIKTQESKRRQANGQEVVAAQQHAATQKRSAPRRVRSRRTATFPQVATRQQLATLQLIETRQQLAATQEALRLEAMRQEVAAPHQVAPTQHAAPTQQVAVQHVAPHPVAVYEPNQPPRLCRSCGIMNVWGQRTQCHGCDKDEPLRMNAAEALIMLSRGKW